MCRKTHFSPLTHIPSLCSFLANKRQKEAFSKQVRTFEFRASAPLSRLISFALPVPFQTTLMLSEPKWTFDLYLRAAREQRVAAGAHGWRLRLLPWLRNSAVAQQLQTHDRVVAAMLPIHRADPANLGAEAKNEIAQRSGCTLQQVNSVIKQVPTLPLPPILRRMRRASVFCRVLMRFCVVCCR
jgi:hypothetical protein